MRKKSSVTERSKIVNSLPRIATSTANALNAITFSLKSPSGGIKIPCTYGYVYTAPVQFGAESKVLLIGLPSTQVLRNRYDSDPANRYSFDPATKANYS